MPSFRSFVSNILGSRRGAPTQSPSCPDCGEPRGGSDTCSRCGAHYIIVSNPVPVSIPNLGLRLAPVSELNGVAPRRAPPARRPTPTPENPSNPRPPPPAVSPAISAPDAHLVRLAIKRWDNEAAEEAEGKEDPHEGAFEKMQKAKEGEVERASEEHKRLGLIVPLEFVEEEYNSGKFCYPPIRTPVTER